MKGFKCQLSSLQYSVKDMKLEDYQEHSWGRLYYYGNTEWSIIKTEVQE